MLVWQIFLSKLASHTDAIWVCAVVNHYLHYSSKLISAWRWLYSSKLISAWRWHKWVILCGCHTHMSVCSCPPWKILHGIVCGMLISVNDLESNNIMGIIWKRFKLILHLPLYMETINYKLKGFSCLFSHGSSHYVRVLFLPEEANCDFHN